MRNFNRASATASTPLAQRVLAGTGGNPGILGIFDEINATDGSEWSYRVRDRRTGVTAQIDGWTGEGGPDESGGSSP